MPSSITQKLRDTFELASIRREFRALRTGADFDKSKRIVESYAQERKKANQDYTNEYDTRVEVALQKLIDKVGAKRRDFTRRFASSDKFDGNALLRQARRNVQLDHKRHITQLDQNESAELKALATAINKRDNLRDKIGQEFTRAADRRSGSERRQTHDRWTPTR